MEPGGPAHAFPSCADLPGVLEALRGAGSGRLWIPGRGELVRSEVADLAVGVPVRDHRLDSRRLEARVRQSQARVAAQEEALRKLQNGARPEEISQARAAVNAAQAEAENGRGQFERLQAGGPLKHSAALLNQHDDVR